MLRKVGASVDFCPSFHALGWSCSEKLDGRRPRARIFIRFYRFLGGYTPKKHWIFSRETGWSCSEFCTEAIVYISKLYKVESEADEAKLTAEQRKKKRVKESYPVILVFEKWMKDMYPTVLPNLSFSI